MKKVARETELARAELLISYVLRYGVLLCLAVIGAGLALRMASPGSGPLIQVLLQGGAPTTALPPTALSALWQGATRLDPDTVIAVGLVMLIGLPIARVGFTTLIFLRERDWAFCAITLLVFSVLLAGIFLGKAL